LVYHLVVTAGAAEEKPPSFICTGLRRFRFADVDGLAPEGLRHVVPGAVELQAFAGSTGL
jgi:hypothetical protein